ncbi:LysE family translocator [Paenibacillus xerothermodurans]|uniref:LysE family translocator n=1 Tax=Paenibacillus xerothermodurans TaxID=1977292 RepID=UPI002436F7AA|nr:LysE family translocator [Paenibacillus xerothermodurans]
MEFSHLWLFIIAVVVLVVTPGPAVLFIVARSIDRGRTAGLLSVLGMAVGGLVHVAAAAIGVSALLVASSLAFSIVKYAGAAYLIYLGCKQLFSSNTAPSGGQATHPKQLKSIFLKLLS